MYFITKDARQLHVPPHVLVQTTTGRSVFPACSGVAIFEIFLPTEATFKTTLGGTWSRTLCTLLLSTDGRKLGLLLCVDLGQSSPRESLL